MLPMFLAQQARPPCGLQQWQKARAVSMMVRAPHGFECTSGQQFPEHDGFWGQ